MLKGSAGPGELATMRAGTAGTFGMVLLWAQISALIRSVGNTQPTQRGKTFRFVSSRDTVCFSRAMAVSRDGFG
jgi:hypothetical protein